MQRRISIDVDKYLENKEYDLQNMFVIYAKILLPINISFCSTFFVMFSKSVCHFLHNVCFAKISPCLHVLSNFSDREWRQCRYPETGSWVLWVDKMGIFRRVFYPIAKLGQDIAWKICKFCVLNTNVGWYFNIRKGCGWLWVTLDCQYTRKIVSDDSS